MARSQYYRDKRKEGDAYEAFIAAKLKLTQRHEGLAAQLAHGDWVAPNGDNVEIKAAIDSAKYGSVFVELFELGRNGCWVESGLWSHADWKWYITGDYDTAYRFARRALSDYCDALPPKRFIINGMGTGVGFRMPFADCLRVCEKRYDFRPAPAPAVEKPAEPTGPLCCGEHAGEMWKGKPLVLACKCCPKSPTYWRKNEHATQEESARPDAAKPARAAKGARRARPSGQEAREEGLT